MGPMGEEEGSHYTSFTQQPASIIQPLRMSSSTVFPRAQVAPVLREREEKRRERESEIRLGGWVDDMQSWAESVALINKKAA